MPNSDAKTILGICGSLRRGSFNRRLLELAGEVAPESLSLSVHEDFCSLPLFNEDLEQADGSPPPAIEQLREAMDKADAILIATPEYNQSMPGVLKNAIDWLSRSAPKSAFANKPVALCGVTVGSWGTRLSQAALRQTLFAAGARLVPLHLYVKGAGTLFPPESAPEEALRSEMRDFMTDLERELQPADAAVQ